MAASEGLGRPKPGKAYKEGNLYTYQEIFPQVDLIYIAENGQLSEQLILKASRQFEAFEERIRLVDLVLAKVENEIHLAPEESGQPIFYFPKPFMYEKENPEVKNEGLKYGLKKTQFGYQLKKVLTPEGKDWLADPERRYPVVIDPTLVKSTVVSGPGVSGHAFGSVQRKIAFITGANDNEGGTADYWYVIYSSTDLYMKRCKQSDGCDADGDWSSAEDIDNDSTGGRSHFKGSLWVDGNTLWVAWIENLSDTLRFVDLDTTTTFPHTAGTYCTSSSQGSLTASNDAYIAVAGNGDIVVGYTTTNNDAEADIFEVPNDTNCTFTSIESGSGLPTGSESFMVVPVAVSSGSDHWVFLIYNDDGGGNDMRVDVRDTVNGTWDSTDTDIDGSQNYNVMQFSATSDGTDIWLFVFVTSTAQPDFFRCGSCSNSSPSFTDESNPFTAAPWANEVSLTYISGTDEIKAFCVHSNQVYADVSVADTISWGTDLSLGYGTTTGKDQLSSVYSVADGDDIGVVVLDDPFTNKDYIFSTVPETSLLLLLLTPFLPCVLKKFKKKKEQQ